MTFADELNALNADLRALGRVVDRVATPRMRLSALIRQLRAIDAAIPVLELDLETTVDPETLRAALLVCKRRRQTLLEASQDLRDAYELDRNIDRRSNALVDRAMLAIPENYRGLM